MVVEDLMLTPNIEFWGDNLQQRDNNLRVIYNNINGLEIKEFVRSTISRRESRNKDKHLTEIKDTQKITGVFSLLRNWQANIICMAETRVAWEIRKVRDLVGKELRKVDRYASVIGSSSEIFCADAYKPGGTGMLCDGNWNSRVVNKGNDPHKLGRWSYLTLRGRNDFLVTIITAYRCCVSNNVNNEGLTTAYAQQETCLRRKGIQTNPRESFITHMEQFIESKVSLGHEIILAIDGNEEWEERGSRIKRMAERVGIFDVAASRNNNKVPATYVRSNSRRRIDFILCSERVLDTITAYGMAPKDLSLRLGDHRLQYIDIDIKALLGMNSHDQVAPTCRRLKSYDPKCVTLYIDEVNKGFSNHTIAERINKLWGELENATEMSPSQERRYNSIDRDVHRLCTSAEKKIGVHKKRRYVWSPELDHGMKVVRYWKSRRKWFGNKPKTEELIRIGVKEGFCTTENKSEESLQLEIASAQRALKEVKSKDKQIRIKYLERLADKYAERNKITKAAAIKALLAHEESREMFRTISLRIKGVQSPQTAEVWLKTPEGERTVLSRCKEVEDHLLTRNRHHLRQAAGTPFADGSLGDEIEEDGTGNLADLILHGQDSVELHQYDDMVKKYIKGMAVKDPAIINSVVVEITLEEYKKFWQRKRESTATSSFGLHIGHYKSSVEDEAILEIHRKLMMMPFRFAMVPQRWAKTIQIMLEKDQGNPWSNRLRIIELFDAQLNCGMQVIFGQRMVRNGLQWGLVHDSAYGSVPARTAQDAVLEKVLTLDMMRVRKKCGAIFDCDAKGCYDRIVAPLQSICSRRLGVPKPTAVLFSRLWNKCEHHVRTRHGTSREYFSSRRGERLYGIGQGNGAGPAFWLSTLIVMFTVLDQVSGGFQFLSPNRETRHESNGMGFVDDVTLGCTENEDEVDNNAITEREEYAERAVLHDITSMAQNWEKMLYTNGGLLELLKCYWLIIAWRWKNGVAQMKSREELNVEMNLVTSEKEERVTIERKATSEAPKILGCHVAATGEWDREYGRWKSESKRFAIKVKNSRLQRSCGYTVYNSIWLAKVRYVAPVVGLTRKQAETIDRPVVAECLRAAGFSKSFPRRVVFGPKKMGGMGWQSCRSLMVTEKVKFFLYHVRLMDKIGKLLKIQTETLQLIAGLKTPILESDIKWTDWTEPTWLHSLKTGLNQFKGKIKTKFDYPQTPRVDDRSLMETFVAFGANTKELIALNRCRIYIKAMFISDIVNYAGDSIGEDAKDVRLGRHSTLLWPNQTRPGKKDRRVWEKYVNRLSREDRLITPLGRWTGPSHQIWPYMLHNDATAILIERPTGQFSHGRISDDRFIKEGRQVHTPTMGIPIQCVPIPVGYKRIFGAVDLRMTVNRRSIWTNYESSLTRTLGRVDCTDIPRLGRLWSTPNTWIVATDGGLKDGIGTSSVVLYNEGGKEEICTAQSAESCRMNSLDSTREELRGNLMAEILVNQLNDEYGKDVNHLIKFVSDSRNALNKIQKKFIHPMEAEYDVTEEIRKLKLSNENIERQYLWVKSHQDKEDKSTEERLNERADHLATLSRRNAANDLLGVDQKLFYSAAKTALMIDGGIVTKNTHEEIISALQMDELKSYYRDKYEWTEQVINSIDWDALHSGMRKHRGSYRTALFKLMHMWQPTNSYVHRMTRGTESTSKCCVCGGDDRQLHYLECEGDFYVKARKDAWKVFEKAMRKYRNEKSLLQTIWVGNTNYIVDEYDGHLPDGPELTRNQYNALVEAYEDQQTIGWKHLFVGRISKKWGEYYRLRVEEDDRCQGLVTEFSRKLVCSIWKFTLYMWKCHNDINHGTNTNYSLRDRKALRDCIHLAYTELRDQITAEDMWLFREEARSKAEEPVAQLIGWLQRVVACINEEDLGENNKLHMNRIRHTLHGLCMKSL